jgi:hypothetical protein
LYVTLTRTRDLARALIGTAAADGANIVIGSLMRTMVVSIGAMFDEDQRTSNLPKVVKRALSPAFRTSFEKFHAHYGVSAMAEASRIRLIKYQRHLKSVPIREAAQRLIRVRMSNVAHFDADPSPLTAEDRAVIRDFDRVVAAAAIVTGEANVFMAGRTVDHLELRKLMRQQAEGFASALKSGLVTPSETIRPVENGTVHE